MTKPEASPIFEKDPDAGIGKKADSKILTFVNKQNRLKETVDLLGKLIRVLY
ncbi:hypothetical protein [Peribacillus simplex]|uniref:hypothetical protein n=1 Tax=Peribacillus simplex TaxID=1478 RepID=UPI00366E6DA7